MNCRATRRRLHALSRGSLPPREAEGVASHLARCGDCRAEAEFESRLFADLAAVRRVPVRAADVRARVLREIADAPLPGREPGSRRDLAWVVAALVVVALAGSLTASHWAPGLTARAARALGGLLSGAAGSITPTTEIATALLHAARATVRALLPGPRLIGSAAVVIHGTALLAGAAALVASATIAGRDLFHPGPRTR